MDFLRTSVQKLDGENYSIWSQKLELLLIREELWEMIKDLPPNPVTSTWTKKNDKARATIGLLIEDNQLLHIKGAQTAREAWDMLREHHQKATLSNTIFLYKRIFRHQLAEGGDVERHVSEMLILIDKLAALGEELKDKLKLSLLLNSLPDSFSNLTISLECRNETDFTFEFVKGRVIDEYRGRKASQGTEATDSDSAMKANFKNQSKRNVIFAKNQDISKRSVFNIKDGKQERKDKVKPTQ